MNDILTTEKPENFKRLIQMAESKGIKDIPIPIEFAKEILIILRSSLVKKTYP